jgi:hypothetical protein
MQYAPLEVGLLRDYTAIYRRVMNSPDDGGSKFL